MPYASPTLSRRSSVSSNSTSSSSPKPPRPISFPDNHDPRDPREGPSDGSINHTSIDGSHGLDLFSALQFPNLVLSPSNPSSHQWSSTNQIMQIMSKKPHSSEPILEPKHRRVLSDNTKFNTNLSKLDLSNISDFPDHDQNSKDTPISPIDSGIFSPYGCGTSYTSSPLVKKKSGELVRSSLKLPSLNRPLSLPTHSKSVHFDTGHMTDVRHFKDNEKPTAVSASSSPTRLGRRSVSTGRININWNLDDSDSESDDGDDSDFAQSSSSSTDSDEEDLSRRYNFTRRRKRRQNWTLNLPNFPNNTHPTRNGAVVFLDRCYINNDKNSVIGHVAVKNLSFNKYVCIRYTFDYWKTVTEVVAKYNDDNPKHLQQEGYDRFTFAIELSALPPSTLKSKAMFFYIRYSVNNCDYYDNNNTLNYEIMFKLTDPSKNDNKPTNVKPKYSKKSSDFSSLNSDTDAFLSASKKINKDNNSKIQSVETYTDTLDEYLRSIRSPRVLFSSPRLGSSSFESMALANPSGYRFPLLDNDQNNAVGYEMTGSSGSYFDRTQNERGIPADPKHTSTNGIYGKSSTNDNSTINKSSKPFVAPRQMSSSERPALDSTTYKNIVESYCFYRS